MYYYSRLCRGDRRDPITFGDTPPTELERLEVLAEQAFKPDEALDAVDYLRACNPSLRRLLLSQMPPIGSATASNPYALPLPNSPEFKRCRDLWNFAYAKECGIQDTNLWYVEMTQSCSACTAPG